ncbi:hypothetical protein [Paenibacillus sp. J22TS3]|uniref:hypothetical protein n=1 Tax=Paenibacillus sp. J22TS3 TaxID=2807192 RepID=UPI001B2F068B|nr:hypothetical protein [Paenibacillus sp. J22TS3]GIP22645.1 hypothetical protein J22TS3_29200 [Paenibacillus sp. J22TS3]
MKASKLLASFILLISIPMFLGSSVDAQAVKPQDIMKKKYPKEVITVIKTADINADKKNESFVLTKSGNFYYVDSKGAVALINTGIISDEEYGEDPSIQIYPVSKKEKHVAVTYSFFPSNTQLYVYRLQGRTLKKVLQLMGDQGVKIDPKGRVHQYWKKYREEGGWDPVEGILTWNSKTNTYKGTGQYILQK